MRVGVDTGGTFTDFVVVDDDGGMRTHKIASTPSAPERAIVAGLDALGVAGRHVLVNGSTVATNAVLEGKGARTVFVTSHGFGDTLTIARQTRRRLYDLKPEAVEPPVPADLCIETGGRMTPAGETLEPLHDADLVALREKISTLAPEAVAINLLFSFVDDTHERRIEAVMPDGVFVARSSEVLPEIREYERGIATWLNARVGPLMRGYLERLAAAIPGMRLSVMQSSAGTVSAAQAAHRGVHLLLSGPAGGVMGAAMLARHVGTQRLLTFDMGGTSTDVALVAGVPKLTSEGHVGGFPVAVPMVDIHTIGAGGGSVAWIDTGGALQVGPRSAGADPGPACYGLGGREPTVTDAHLVLGHLPRAVPLAGSLRLNAAAARGAFEPLAERLGLTVAEVADGVLQVAEEHMVQALRVISVERGEDPREYALFPFGGAGGLHVCALAERLGMGRALAPANAGVLSALGMLAAPRAREASRTVPGLLRDADRGALGRAFDELEGGARAELEAEGVRETDITTTRSVDLRYVGQSFTLQVPWDDTAESGFHARHETRYGHCLDLPVELVNLRVRVEAPNESVDLPRRARTAAIAPMDDQAGVPVFEWTTLPAGQVIDGPAIVAAPDATVRVTEGWSATVDAWGNLALVRRA